MSAPHRSLGPVIAYMLTVLGLVLGGIWLWNVVHNTALPRHIREAQSVPPQAASTPPSSEDLSATERQQLEDILRRKSAAGQH